MGGLLFFNTTWLIASVMILATFCFMFIVRKVYKSRHASQEAFRALARKHRFVKEKTEEKELVIEGVYRGLAFTARPITKVNKGISTYLFALQVKTPFDLPLTEFLPKNRQGYLSGIHSWHIPHVSLLNEVPYRVFSREQKFVQSLDTNGLSKLLQEMKTPVIVTIEGNIIEASIKDGFDSWTVENLEEHLNFFIHLTKIIFSTVESQ